MDGPNNGIVLYHYSFSPFARRITWYLALRGLDYAQCNQPPVLPRPDLSELLGVKYRRIPLLAIGRDIYCDTRLILAKLEQLFPDSPLAARTKEHEAIQRLLSTWKIESGVFVSGSQLIPSDLPLLRDPKFQKDRQDFSGRSWDKSKQDALRPEAVANIRRGFDLLESTLLADGRDWVLKTESPSLADIEAIWVFHWLESMKGALPEDVISKKQYPKAFAWIARFNQTMKAARAKAPKPTTLKGKEAAQRIESAAFAENQLSVDSNDPLKLQAGTKVAVWPTDSGFKHKDTGTLLGLDANEIVIGVKTQSGQDIRIHCPRQQFRIETVSGDSSSKL